MIRILNAASNWKFILPLFLLFAIFSFFLFPEYQSKMTEAAGEELAPLDTRFSYNTEEVTYFFDKLGPDGRDIYGTVAGRIDMLYPIVYAALFALVIAYLAKKLTHPDSKWLLVALLPVGGMIFDYLENFNTINLLKNYPNITADAVNYGQQMTRVKHVLLLFSVGLIIVLAVVVLVRKIARQKKRS
jgi:hypothetical protein